MIRRRFSAAVAALAVSAAGLTWAAAPASATLSGASINPSVYAPGSSPEIQVSWSESSAAVTTSPGNGAYGNPSGGNYLSVEVGWGWTFSKKNPTNTPASYTATWVPAAGSAPGGAFECRDGATTFASFASAGFGISSGSALTCLVRRSNNSSDNPGQQVVLSNVTGTNYFTLTAGSTITVTFPAGTVTAPASAPASDTWRIISLATTPNPAAGETTTVSTVVPAEGTSGAFISITIDANGGVCRTTQVTGVETSWAAAPGADNCATRDTRSIFTGYNTKADGSGLAIAPGGALNLTGDNTLYAIYTAPRNPGAPTDVQAVAGRNAVTVSWKAPTDRGVPTLTAYMVESNPPGYRCRTSVSSSDPTSCTIKVPGSNTPYTFSVIADNFFGVGPAAASNPVKPFDLVLETADRPKASLVDRLFKGQGSTLSFEGRAPGLAGSTFTPQMKVGSGAWTNEGSGKVGAKGELTWSKPLSAKLDKQAVGVRFIIGSEASNEYSVEVGKNAGVPSAPRDLKLKAGLAEYTVSWKAPAKDGGSPITSYVVTSNLKRFSCKAKAPETSCVIYQDSRSATGPVEYSVTAVSARGEGKVAKAAGEVVYRWIQPLSVTTYPSGDKGTELNVLFYAEGLQTKQATVELRIGKDGSWKKKGNPDVVNRPNRMYWSTVLGQEAFGQPLYLRVSTPFGTTRVRQIR